MPEVARCNTIEVDEAAVRAGSKIGACDQVEQPLAGPICGRDKQAFLVARDWVTRRVSQRY
jgi:hypothetical protein